ncbi:hydantoinase B/oxoprolinase family protein [Paraburkholderia sp. UCT2]|uniref:hydantoinase B/oxoprolinase family protein n=1 Tax=Paraburkholderia sp. UCT2 TaxID=2615208 RepID=UPI00223ADD63|nr:hydantoinase B/oxoprolinase family protein [Paraburkholderia sp. UCT2]
MKHDHASDVCTPSRWQFWIDRGGTFTAPFGAAGGRAGRRGSNRVERADGEIVALGHIASVEMAAGDVFVVETPGGGGFGQA